MTPEQLKTMRAMILDYKHVFATPEGLRVLADLAKQCYERELTYIDGNAAGSAFNEGKRYVILHIRRLVDADMEQLERTMNNG